jgi:hypothetical protein
MEIVSLLFCIVVLILIGVGFAIGLVACVLAAVLLGLGVISSSFVIGLWSGRPSAAMRAFLIQCGVLAGIPAGAACAWLAKTLVAEASSEWVVLFSGALAGATAGVAIALMLDFVFRRMHAWGSSRFLSARQVQPAIEGNAD